MAGVTLGGLAPEKMIALLPAAEKMGAEKTAGRFAGRTHQADEHDPQGDALVSEAERVKRADQWRKQHRRRRDDLIG